MKLYTIGYSGFPEIKQFISRLKEYKINVLIDVRSSPYSAYYEAYNKENLKRQLNEAGIIYRNYAVEFGARQEEKKFYFNGRMDFDTFTASPQFQEGFQKLYKNLNDYTFTLMCAEKDPISCHRTIMISRKFDEAGVDVLHIWPGKVQPHSEIKKELLDMYFPDRNQLQLFSEPLSDEEMLSIAYQKQNDIIGFKEIDLLK